MIADSQNKALLLLAELFKDEVNYQKYLLYREKGLRKQSFVFLDKFIKEFEVKYEAVKNKKYEYGN